MREKPHPFLDNLEVCFAHDDDEAGDLLFVRPFPFYGTLMTEQIGLQLTRGSLPRSRQRKIFSQVVSALAHLHELDVPHGAIRPHNIEIRTNGNITLVN